MTRSLTLAHLYPDHMNIYGDRGNLITLVQRCRWRNITLRVQPVTVGASVDWSDFDLAFFGGGQDSGQALIADDFLRRQGEGVARAIEDGLVMLAICGGYQLLGHYFLTHTGERLPGVGVLDIHTIGGKNRLIGNTVLALHTPFPAATAAPSPSSACPAGTSYLVGFENHSGRTYHGARVAALGHIITGYGDNREDGKGGAVYRNTIGCYLHGSLLPKNPHLADHLLTLALQRRYGPSTALPLLEALDDTLEWQAHWTMVERLLKRVAKKRGERERTHP
ncbi:MAG: glutamine amidotransferase [Chloroflexaceae bacterium]|nr:glutamine amidotransferase [Chloroflexaceae bacterium]